ncbi:MAG TPA: type II toxin-antitoxin system PemK/MazF family toxin [Stellaceae bacterium]
MRGDIVSVAAGGGYGGKPRPAVIVQADAFSASPSVTVCLISSVFVDASDLRPKIEPNRENGLRAESWALVDKIVTLPVRKVGGHIGKMRKTDMARLDSAIVIFLGLAR